jgi:hypothetical protein
MQLEQVPKGFQDIYEGTADEDIELPAEPVQQLTGNSTMGVRLLSPRKLELTVRADGDIGSSSVAVTVDGHIGDGEVPIRLEFNWDTVHKDATEITGITKVRREPIPTA